MRRSLFLLLALIAFCSSAQAAQPGLSDVLGARRLLSPSVWSRVLRIDRETSEGASSKSFYALVFEVASVLWVYSPLEGTKSLSHFVGRTLEEKTRLGSLLDEAYQGVKSWCMEEEANLPKTKSRDIPGNACFIQSLALLDERRRKGYNTESASLFTFYYVRQGTTRGHTVLLYKREGETFAIDPADGEALCYRVERDMKPAQLARMLARGLEVKTTRELPMNSYLRGEESTSLVSVSASVPNSPSTTMPDMPHEFAEPL